MYRSSMLHYLEAMTLSRLGPKYAYLISPLVIMKGFKEIEKAFYTARNYEFLKMRGDC